MSLKVKKAPAELTVLRFNKEGSGEEGDVPLYLNLDVTCLAEDVLPTILDCTKMPEFWEKGNHPDLVAPGLGQFSSPSKITAVTATINGLELKNCKVTALKGTLKPGKVVDLKCCVISKEAGEHEVALMRQILKQPISISLEGGDLVDQARASGEEEDDAQQDIED